MPNPYFLTQAQADALDRWVKAGGVLLCDAHLAGYDGTTGRHGRVLPGCGLAESWGIREIESTSSHHLPRGSGPAFDLASLSDDERKALKDSDAAGGTLFPIRLADGAVVWGAHRYAVLAGDAIEPLGSFDGSGPCIVRAAVASGQVFYCGTNVAQAAAAGAPAALARMLGLSSGAAGIAPTGAVGADLPGTVHLDLLEVDRRPAFAVVTSRADVEQRARITGGGLWRGTWRGLFDGERWPMDGETEVRVPAGFAEIFAIEDAAGTTGSPP